MREGGQAKETSVTYRKTVMMLGDEFSDSREGWRPCASDEGRVCAPPCDIHEMCALDSAELLELQPRKEL